MAVYHHWPACKHAYGWILAVNTSTHTSATVNSLGKARQRHCLAGELLSRRIHCSCTLYHQAFPVYVLGSLRVRHGSYALGWYRRRLTTINFPVITSQSLNSRLITTKIHLSQKLFLGPVSWAGHCCLAAGPEIGWALSPLGAEIQHPACSSACWQMVAFPQRVEQSSVCRAATEAQPGRANRVGWVVRHSANLGNL